MSNLLLMGAGGGGGGESFPAGPWAGTAFNSAGAWTWFVDPRAIYHGGTHRRLYVGFVSSLGSPSVAQYDLDTKQLSTHVLHPTLEADDHDNPSLIVLPDGRIRAFYCKHAKDGEPLYTRVTTSAEDITSWEAEQQITSNLTGTSGFSYPKPFILTAESNRMYVFFRSASFAHAYITSDDDGATWSAATALFTNGTERPYFQAASNGVDTIHFTCTDGHPRDATNNLYHFYYQDGSLYNSDGSLIGGVAGGTGPSGVTKIYDNTTNGEAWGWDLIVDSDGNPRVVYATFPTTSAHSYRYARWTGTEWQDAEVVANAGADIHPGLIGGAGDGEPNYSGGVAIDPTHPQYVYASTQTDTAEWDIYRYVSTDDGATWALDDTITSDTGVKNIRPYVPRGMPSGAPRLLWLKGNSTTNGGYTTYLSYNTSVMAGAQPTITATPDPAADTTIALDEFVGTNGTRLNVHAPDTGSEWVDAPAHGSSFFEIRTNRASPTTTSGACALIQPSIQPGISYAIEVGLRIISATGFAGPAGYLDQELFTGYHARYNFSTAKWEMFRTVNNTSTALGTPVAATFTAGNTVTARLELRPSSQKLFVDDVETITATDTQIVSGMPGIRAGSSTSSTGVHIERVEVTAL